MAIELVKATAITNADASNPSTNNSLKLAGGKVKRHMGVGEFSATASIGSILRFARVWTGWSIDAIRLSSDALTGAAADVGVYDVAAAGGAVIDADFFASAVSLAAAQVNVDVTHEADAADAGAGYGLADVEKTLGAALGLTTDKWVDLAVTFTAAATAAGTVVGKAYVVDNN